MKTQPTIKDPLFADEAMYESLIAATREAADYYDDQRFGSPKVSKRALSKFSELNSSYAALVAKAYEEAAKASFERRSYGRGNFFSWVYWEEGPCAELDVGDPWPAQRWPKDTLAAELVYRHAAGEVSLI